MAYVVNFTDEEGTEKNRIIPASNTTILFEYFDEYGRYSGATVNAYWNMQEFTTMMKDYSESVFGPQKLDSVAFENAGGIGPRP